MIHIDGSFGEGGGQILRTSLALSLVTGKPFRIDRIRAQRKKSGLGRQHLTAVSAAVEIGHADVKGNALGSPSVYFAPKSIQTGKHHFSVGTAGSATLVLQTILPALLLADGSSQLILEGGTHNPYAPPFDFLKRTFLPILRRMGANVTAELERPGFYPAGGGRFSVTIKPCQQLSRLDLLERGTITELRATALVANLPKHIGDREISVVSRMLGLNRRDVGVQEIKESHGPGNALLLSVESQYITEVFSGFGERGVRAETVAKRTVKQVHEYLKAGVPVGRYLADQLIIPMTLAGGGRFRTLSPSLHTTTNIEIVKCFLDIEVTLQKIAPNIWEIEVFSEQ